MLTRRAALASLAGGALALSGCDAIRRLRGRHGCTTTAQLPLDGVTLRSFAYRSRFVRVPIGVAFAFPAHIDPHTIERVIYLLPGRDGTAAATLHLNYAAALLALPAAHQAVVIAAIDAGDSYFHRRAAGEDRLAAVTRELPQLVHAHTGARPVHETLAGFSMGGYGSVLAAEHEPARFRAVSVCGPAIFPSYDDENRSVGDAFDSAADFARHDVVAGAGRLRNVAVRIRYGAQDPFGAGIRRFARACPAADVAELPGCHDDGFWSGTAVDSIAFLAHAMTHA
jgi:pimeloyl-ACP methyl ester carboxylesterase